MTRRLPLLPFALAATFAAASAQPSPVGGLPGPLAQEGKPKARTGSVDALHRVTPLPPFSLPANSLKGLRICLAPSVGTGPDGDLVLPLALYLENLLSRAGAAVVSTRFGALPYTTSAKGSRQRVRDILTAGRAGLLLGLYCSTGNTFQTGVAVDQREETGLLARCILKAATNPVGINVCGQDPIALPVPELQALITLPTGGPRTRFRKPAQELARALHTWWQKAGKGFPERIRLLYPNRAPRPWTPRSFWHVERAPKTEREVASLIRAWQRGYAIDPTQTWLEAKVIKTANGWQLTGSTELPVLERALKRVFDRAGVKPLTGSLRRLPEAGICAGGAFGVVKVAAALTWRHPTQGAGLSVLDGAGQTQQTQVLYGDPVWVLDRRAGHLLVHAHSGYVGWVHEDAVHRLQAGPFQTWLGRCHTVRREVRLAKLKIRLPIGSSLPPGPDLDTAGGLLGILPPGGWACTRLPSASLRPVSPDPDAPGRAAARTALEALGTPYLWGGRSRLGIDCSGLVQTSWKAEGVLLPRDSRMQFLTGELVVTANCPPSLWAALRPGDLLFFATASGRIGHVAMSLGGSRFVHAVMPEVTIGSLDPKDPLYTPTARRFVCAKRVRP